MGTSRSPEGTDSRPDLACTRLINGVCFSRDGEGIHVNIPGEIISEVKKAVERGPIYVLVLAGVVLLVGVDPAEFYAPSKHILSPAEFITVNIVAGVLIIVAATLGLLSSIAAMRTLEQISATSSDANIRAIEALKNISSGNAVLQMRSPLMCSSLANRLAVSSIVRTVRQHRLANHLIRRDLRASLPFAQIPVDLWEYCSSMRSGPQP
jgi:hypothetical protein